MRIWFQLGLHLILAVMFSVSVLTAQLNAQETRPTSLDIVPQGAAFYWASMNHQAQYEAIVDSNAYARLMDTPVAKKMRRAYRKGRRRGDWDQFGRNPFREYLEGYSQTIGSAQGKIVLPFVKQIFGNEVFVYADDDWNTATDAVGRAYARVFEEVLKGTDPAEMEPEEIRRILRLVADELKDANTPTIVMGTVLDEPKQIKGLLQMAEDGIDQMIGRMPPEMDALEDAYDVIEDDESYLITFEFTADLIPWDMLAGDPGFAFAEFTDEIQALIENKSVALTFGIKNQYLLLSVGPSADHIVSLGKGPLLIDHEKLAPLKQTVAPTSLTSVSYASDAFMKRNSNLDGLIDYATTMLELGMRSGGGQPGIDDLLGDLRTDSAELKSDLRSVVPAPGAILSFSFMNSEGLESFKYNWSENKHLDDSKPLTVLQHVGARPALVVAARDKGSAEQYELLAKWCRKIVGYLDTYVPRFIEDENDAALFEDLMSDLTPVLEKLDTATSENLMPAIANSQFALLVDFAVEKPSWHAEMPESEHPLPLPALAMVVQVNDADKIKRAGSLYFESAKEILEIIRALPDAEIPEEFQIPDPQFRQVAGGEMFYYPIPSEAGLPSSLIPHVLLGNDWLVLSYSTDQSQWLMNATSPEFLGPLSDTGRPLMAAAYYDNVETMDAVFNWAKYAHQLAREEGHSIALNNEAESDGLDFSEDELIESAHAVFDLLKCFRAYSSASYMKDGAQVTHAQCIFRDISEE